MIQVDLPGAFAVGHFCAFLSRHYLKQEPDKFTNNLMGPLNLYLSIFFVPAALFLLIGWPSWESMYLWSWLEFPYNKPLVSGFYVTFMIFLIVLGNFGFIFGHQLIRLGKDNLVFVISLFSLILTVLPFFLRWGVWMRIGTYADFHAGLGYSFWEPPFFYGWLFIISYLLIAMLIFWWWLWKRDKRFISRRNGMDVHADKHSEK